MFFPIYLFQGGFAPRCQSLHSIPDTTPYIPKVIEGHTQQWGSPYMADSGVPEPWVFVISPPQFLLPDSDFPLSLSYRSAVVWCPFNLARVSVKFSVVGGPDVAYSLILKCVP